MAEAGHEPEMKWLFLIFYIVLGSIDAYASEHNGRRILKPFLVPILYLFLYSSEGSVPFFLGLGLLAGWAGDILLMQKTHFRMTAGTVLFLLGHLFYAVYFSRHILLNDISAVVMIVLPVLYVLTGVILEKRIMYDQPADKKTGSIIYMAAIGLMSYLSLLAALTGGMRGMWVSWTGSVLFIISDSFILDQTVHHKPQKHVMPTYLGAQLLIVSGDILCH